MPCRARRLSNGRRTNIGAVAENDGNDQVCRDRKPDDRRDAGQRRDSEGEQRTPGCDVVRDGAQSSPPLKVRMGATDTSSNLLRGNRDACNGVAVEINSRFVQAHVEAPALLHRKQELTALIRRRGDGTS